MNYPSAKKYHPTNWPLLGISSLLLGAVSAFGTGTRADVVVLAGSTTPLSSKPPSAARAPKCHRIPTGSWIFPESHCPPLHTDLHPDPNLFQGQSRFAYSEMLQESTLPGVNQFFALPRNMVPSFRKSPLPGLSRPQPESSATTRDP